MICLNYHRVDEDEDPDIYTVSPARLALHLEEIKKRGLRVATVEEALSATVDDGFVMLTFDDGTADHLNNVIPLLEQAGVKGIFFVSTSYVGRSGYLTQDQVREISAAGHDIECHGHIHRRMDTMTPDTLRTELAKSMALIREWTGKTPRVLAPPGGYISPQVIAAAREAGLSTVRTMNWNTNRIPLGSEVDCLVITRSVTDEAFRGWLAGKGMLKLRCTFLAKQTIRSLMPFGLYLKLRNFLTLR